MSHFYKNRNTKFLGILAVLVFSKNQKNKKPTFTPLALSDCTMVGPTLWGAGGLHTQCAATACSNCSLKWHHVQSLHVVSVPGFIILYEKTFIS